MKNENYGETFHVHVGAQLYQLQALNKPEETLFLIKRSGDSVCTLSLDDNGKWHSDSNLFGNELSEIIRWIEKLFL